MAKKYHAFGAKLQRSDGAGGWDDVAGLRHLNGPALSKDTTDVTTHDSVDAYNEYLQGTKELGEYTFDLVWDPEDTAAQADLFADYQAGPDTDPVDFRLVFKTANSKTWAFSAYVTGWEPKNPVKGEIAASVSMKLTGKPTFTVA